MYVQTCGGIGKHNDTWTVPGYYSHIAKFLRATQDGDRANDAPKKPDKQEQEHEEAEDSDGWERLDCADADDDHGGKVLEEMSISELRGKLRKRNVDCTHCVEKQELVALLERSLKSD